MKSLAEIFGYSWLCIKILKDLSDFGTLEMLIPISHNGIKTGKGWKRIPQKVPVIQISAMAISMKEFFHLRSRGRISFSRFLWDTIGLSVIVKMPPDSCQVEQSGRFMRHDQRRNIISSLAVFDPRHVKRKFLLPRAKRSKFFKSSKRIVNRCDKFITRLMLLYYYRVLI